MSRFLQCKECHGICLVLFGKEDAGCGTYEKLHANTSDGAVEKHLPVVEIDGKHITVKVGSIFHPMTEEHSIGWVCLVTKAGCTMRVCLNSDCEPVAHFTLEQGDSPVAAYAYCNLHGLWKTNI